MVDQKYYQAFLSFFLPSQHILHSLINNSNFITAARICHIIFDLNHKAIDLRIPIAVSPLLAQQEPW
jgi:hypothetical protein